MNHAKDARRMRRRETGSVLLIREVPAVEEREWVHDEIRGLTVPGVQVRNNYSVTGKWKSENINLMRASSAMLSH